MLVYYFIFAISLQFNQLNIIKNISLCQSNPCVLLIESHKLPHVTIALLQVTQLSSLNKELLLSVSKCCNVKCVSDLHLSSWISILSV